MSNSETDSDTVELPSGIQEVGPIVVDYEILATIGRSLLEIFKARQVSSGRVVAIKVIRAASDFADRSWALMQREAAILGSLDHPGIVKLIECGERDGIRFLAYEYVDGCNLQVQRHCNPLGFREAAALVERIARAVNHAHQRGIIHGDLKPSRIELAPDGSPKIGDFHLARRLPVVQDDEFPEGAIVGNPAYMAPEQARGILSEIGTAVDIYGLGGILHALLTGRPPNRGKSGPEFVEWLLAREPEPLYALPSNAPRDLEAITLKCLRRNPAERYPSAETLADDLKRFLTGEAVAARPLGRIGRIVRWLSRRVPSAC
jgi:serine/threonine-protein kinase